VFLDIIKILIQIQKVVLLLVVIQFKQVRKLVTMETQQVETDVQLIAYLLKQAGCVRLQLILVLMCALNEQLDIFKIVLLIRLNESLIVGIVEKQDLRNVTMETQAITMDVQLIAYRLKQAGSEQEEVFQVVTHAPNVQMDFIRIMCQILTNVFQYVEMALKQQMKSETMVTQQPLMDVQLIDLQLRQAGCVY
jgi:hypothetical protein